MNRKKFFYNFKNENGLTGADVAIAVSVLVTTIVIVAMLYINIDLGNKSVNRNAGATRIATNILENIKLTEYEKIGLNKLGVFQETQEFSNEKVYNTKVPNGYTAIITVNENVLSTDEFKLVKNIIVEVKYKLNGEESNIKLNTSIEEKFYEECNTPDLSYNFLVNSSDLETKQLTSKIFVPIKYSYLSGKYKATNEDDNEWYNYSSKEWAKVLIFEDEETQNKFIDINGNVNTEEVEIDGNTKTFKNYLYVWIPNFGKSVDIVLEDSTTVEGKYYFRYGKESTSIDKNALVFKETKKTAENLILKTYNIDTSVEFSESGNGAVVMGEKGFWRLYNENPSIDTAYGLLNESDYGPQLVH